MYEEAGFKATDNKGNDLTNQVKIIGEVNPAVAGEYTITYTLEDKTVTRTILVVPTENQVTYLILSGQTTMFLKVGETYNEPGYQIIDNLEDDLKDKVVITGNVNTNKSGTYKLIYTVTNKSGETIREERTIIVMDSTVNITYSPTIDTNEDVTINISVNDNYFDYLLLPDGTKITSRDATFEVTKNDIYNFTIYSKDGSSKQQEVIINNIDKVPPKINSCTGNIDKDTTTFIVKTNDTDITKYVYNNKYTATSKTYIINESITKVNLVAYDQAGNTTQTECTAVYPPIKPLSTQNIIKHADSETIKFWIEQKFRGDGRPSFFAAHIWVKDAYNQLKSGVPNNFGNEILKPEEIFTQKINKLGLQNKYAIAVNGSAFVSLEAGFSTNLYYKNNDFNNTSVSPIVISEGKVLRDSTSKRFNNFETYGLKKNGWLERYIFDVDTEENKQKNIAVAQRIISDGVKNTWSFTPVFIYDGKGVKATQTTSQSLITAICQINENNFVLVSDTYSSPRRGFSFLELQNYMLSLGCKYGFNLDGGGSVSMMYKDKDSATPTVVRKTTRRIADILYFHEQ